MEYHLKPEILQKLKRVKQTVKKIEEWYNQNPNDLKRWKYWSLTRFLTLQGLRISEALSLRWEDVNFEEKTAWVIQLKKRKKLTREIPLHSKVYEALLKFPGTERKGKIWDITRQTVFLFYQKYGLNPHVFRHYFATMLLKKGENLENVRRALGHSGYSFLKIYLNIELEDLRESIEQISLF